MSITLLPVERGKKLFTFFKLAAEDFDIEPTSIPDRDSKDKEEERYT